MTAQANWTYPQGLEPGKPNPGYGGARSLFGDHRDTHPETYKHLMVKNAPLLVGAG